MALQTSRVVQLHGWKVTASCGTLSPNGNRGMGQGFGQGVKMGLKEAGVYGTRANHRIGLPVGLEPDGVEIRVDVGREHLLAWNLMEQRPDRIKSWGTWSRSENRDKKVRLNMLLAGNMAKLWVWSWDHWFAQNQGSGAEKRN
eukprot:7580576-Ditylum_brightwellii.AAC.1